MTEDRKLLVGVDLSNDFTQLSCYRRDIDKVIPAGRLVGREREYECPIRFILAAGQERVAVWNRGTDGGRTRRGVPFSGSC